MLDCTALKPGEPLREERPLLGADNVFPNSEEDAFLEDFMGLDAFFLLRVEPKRADDDGAPGAVAPVSMLDHTSMTGPAFVGFFTGAAVDWAREVVPDNGVRLFDGLFEGLLARKAAAAFLMTSAISSARAYASAD